MYLPSTSRELIMQAISGPAGLDLTTLPVQIALVSEGAEPADGDYHTASWIDGEAALLVGPGSEDAVSYPPGEYMLWWRLTSGAEQPSEPAGRVRIGDTRF